ncbi:hypothetical protein EGW08_023671 [Elysia chlorotica]|uniref:Deoxynucleoside kinase domain-containing protein n=1 Tax=Elysia chlorotica TaxID=188477 RepID=A0A3S1GYA7_ELYCH|nr:hypothetical protein EGW08_023671 [Elysia chlorotica]
MSFRLIGALRRGARPLVICNTKCQAHLVRDVAVKHLLDEGLIQSNNVSDEVVIISGDTSPDVRKNIMGNIRKKLEGCRMFIYTTAFKVGIDINFYCFDEAYLIVDQLSPTNTPSIVDLFQCVGRSRLTRVLNIFFNVSRQKKSGVKETLIFSLDAKDLTARHLTPSYFNDKYDCCDQAGKSSFGKRFGSFSARNNSYGEEEALAKVGLSKPVLLRLRQKNGLNLHESHVVDPRPKLKLHTVFEIEPRHNFDICSEVFLCAACQEPIDTDFSNDEFSEQKFAGCRVCSCRPFCPDGDGDRDGDGRVYKGPDGFVTIPKGGESDQGYTVTRMFVALSYGENGRVCPGATVGGLSGIESLFGDRRGDKDERGGRTFESFMKEARCDFRMNNARVLSKAELKLIELLTSLLNKKDPLIDETTQRLSPDADLLPRLTNLYRRLFEEIYKNICDSSEVSDIEDYTPPMVRYFASKLLQTRECDEVKMSQRAEVPERATIISVEGPVAVGKSTLILDTMSEQVPVSLVGLCEPIDIWSNWQGTNYLELAIFGNTNNRFEFHMMVALLYRQSLLGNVFDPIRKDMLARRAVVFVERSMWSEREVFIKMGIEEGRISAT